MRRTYRICWPKVKSTAPPLRPWLSYAPLTLPQALSDRAHAMLFCSLLTIRPLRRERCRRPTAFWTTIEQYYVMSTVERKNYSGEALQCS